MIREDDGPPEVPGVRWHDYECVGCGETFWMGVSRHDSEDDAWAVVQLKGQTCADCRAVEPQAWSPPAWNREQRRAANRR